MENSYNYDYDDEDEDEDEKYTESKNQKTNKRSMSQHGNKSNDINNTKRTKKIQSCSTSSSSSTTASLSKQTTSTSSSFTKPGNHDIIPKFSICTYNIWFGPAHPGERMAKIALLLSNLKPNKPMFIGLQEVTVSLKLYLFPYLEQMGYTMICQPMDGDSSYGVAIGILTQVDHQPKEQQQQEQTYCHCTKIIKSGFLPYTQIQL
mmetsp:Transcript_26183/g.30410  ORF Transcript_26183/g.30410 Transcript_26183/m.30410 type:complete len:205 (+) Transcript_26183:2-616(+)